jgi:protein gp37
MPLPDRRETLMTQMLKLEIEPQKADEWVPRIQSKLADSVEAIVGVGREFIAAKRALPHGEFGRLAELLNFSPLSIQRFMAIARNKVISNASHGMHLPSSWRTLYELSRLDPPRLQLALDRGEISAEIERKQAQKIVREYLALGETDSSNDDDADNANDEPKLQTFNAVNENIGWARWSWNPVTGCLHNCDYCYARDIAERFYPQKFEPTFFPERLEAPANTRLPAKADDDPAWRRVFTCSMADLFGKWVPQKWIKAVFERIQEHQEWEFLCLTKFPQRLAELEWPPNVWAGTTVDRQHRVETAERSFRNVKAGVKWLSCEPLLEPLKFTSLSMFDWVVIGASTGSTLVAPFAPNFEWIADLYNQARAAGCRVYLKHNLFGSEEGRSPGMQAIREWPR